MLSSILATLALPFLVRCSALRRATVSVAPLSLPPPPRGRTQTDAQRRTRSCRESERRILRAEWKRATRAKRNRWLARRDPGLAWRPPPVRVRVPLGPGELTEPHFDLLGLSEAA